MSSVLPHFPLYTEGTAFKKQLLDIATKIDRVHPEMAQAIRSLVPKAEIEAKEKFYGPLNSRNFIGAMLSNLTMTTSGFQAPQMWNAIVHARLAHLVASSIAELDLRERAKNDAQAAALVQRLNQIQTCEKNLF